MVCSITNGDLKIKENSKDSQSIFAIIQCDKTKNSTSSNELFTSLSMLALRVYSNYLSQRFENKVSQIERQRLQTRTINVFENFKNIAEEYYLPNIFEKVSEALPAIYKAKKCCLFVKDLSKDNTLYTASVMGEDTSNNNIKFIKAKVKYPNNIGYTGYCCKVRMPVVYINPKYDKNNEYQITEFNPELDNYLSEAEVQNAIYSPTIDGDGNIQGVIQLINIAKGYDNLDSNYLKEISCISAVIGTTLK